MALYSLMLACVLVAGAPYWLWRLARSGAGWTADLAQRLGRVPRKLRDAVARRQVVWVHAVSVGEVLAATQLVAELERSLAEGWSIVISTTTATGQALARQRFSGEKDSGGADRAARVFYYPVDFAWAVRAYLRVIRPKMVVLMESELWPRMLVECGRTNIPVAVANARVSDRSFSRGMRVRAIWGRMLRRVDLFLARSDEDARRLVAMGARPDAVRVAGNLKYDAPEQKPSAIVVRLDALRGSARLVIAGSTLEGEEEMLLAAWMRVQEVAPDTVLVLAPRHPQRFAEVLALIRARGFAVVQASKLDGVQEQIGAGSVVLLDTIGDLAAAYGLAEVAFVGGSLVRRGGHNPLEPARFGVPVVMGPSYENFRDIVGAMRAADGVHIVRDGEVLRGALIEMLADREAARKLGERGRKVFERQRGATERTVAALLELMRANHEGPSNLNKEQAL